MSLRGNFLSFLKGASRVPTWSQFKAEVSGVGLSPLDALDDRYFSHLGYRTAAGTYVSPGSAQRLAAVFACTRVCSETVGSLPNGIMRWKATGKGMEKFPEHPLAPVLRKPNQRQTRFDMWQMIQGHLELRGNAYCEIVPGSQQTGQFRAVDQLIPLHPDRVTVYLMPDGRLRYEVRSYYGSAKTRSIMQDYMVHYRGRSEDGIMGVSTVTAMAEVLGKGLAQQQHAARYFSAGANPSMTLETVKMKDEERQKMAESVSEGFSGPNAFKVMALPPGVSAKALSLTNVDSQLIESIKASAIEICGAWRVPPHKIGDLSRGTFSNIEQQNIEFATDCIRPRVEALECRLDIDVIDPLSETVGLAEGDAFCTFNMDALYRGDLKSRYEAYSKGLVWITRNEMRLAEGWNPIDSPDCDELLVPVAMETVSQASKRSAASIAAKQATAEPDPEDDETENPDNEAEPMPGSDTNDGDNGPAKSRAIALAEAAALRIVRREVTKLRAGSSADVAKIYRDLIPIVSENMAVPVPLAEIYCDRHLGRLYAKPENRDEIIERIEKEGAAELVNFAIEGEQIGVLS